jgi:transmembrane sensor
MSMERTHQIDAVASDWLIRRESGAWSAADQACLDQWLNASTLNRVAFLRLELAWEDAARLKALGAGIAGDRPPPPGHWNLTPFFDAHSSGLSGDDPKAALTEFDSARPSIEGSSNLATPGTHRAKRLSLRRRRLALAAAAALLFVVGSGVYWGLAPTGERYTTPIGGLASVPMADGSKITLNTDSRIRIALTDTERRVELGRGEAFFEVSKDPRRPFVVRAGDRRITAVGTKFSVRAEGDYVEIVVTEGKVRVEDGAAGQRSRADGSADVFLTPGSIARAGEAGVLVRHRTLTEAEEQLSWRMGWLMFRDQALADAIAEFNRYNVRKIVIQDSAIASLKIEGNFRATNVDAFVRLLESGFPVHAEVRADRILLTTK